MERARCRRSPVQANGARPAEAGEAATVRELEFAGGMEMNPMVRAEVPSYLDGALQCRGRRQGIQEGDGGGRTGDLDRKTSRAAPSQS